jgi:hypothetical protein
MEKHLKLFQSNQRRIENMAAANKGLPKAGLTSFYDTFVLNRALVFQINDSAETPRLRQAANRWVQFFFCPK